MCRPLRLGQADLVARYLFEKGKDEQCRRVLVKLHGGKIENGDVELSEAAAVEYEAMRAGTPLNCPDFRAIKLIFSY